MPIEAGTVIEDLDELWPLSGDGLVEGDNHLRLIKAVLKAQFPGGVGQGFNTPITATEAEINFLSGTTGNIQAQLDVLTANDNLIAPAGTILVFYQIAAPVGWTKVTAVNDSMLRVVVGAGGSSAGLVTPTSFTHSHTTGSVTLSIAQMPQHGHPTRVTAVQANSPETTASGGMMLWDQHSPTSHPPHTGAVTNTPGQQVGGEGGSASHNHGTSSSVTWSPRYSNVIFASKD